MNRSAIFALGGLFFLCQSPLAQSVLENGSFEISRNLDPGTSATVARTTQIDSWTVGGANGVFYVGTAMTPSEGKRSVMLQFITANYIEQAIATIPGQKYRVYFDASAYVGPTGTGARLMRGKATARSTGDAIIATKDFSYDGTGKSFPNVGWAAFSYDFTADTALTTLRWESLESGNNGGPSIDNARVVPGRDDGQGGWVVSGPPVFAKALPATTQAVAGRALKLEVEALGDAPLSYQWHRVNNTTFTPIAGATSAAYEIASFAQNQTGVYAVIASNAVATATNRTSVVRVQPPVISGQPDEQHLSAGGSLNFGIKSFSGSAADRFQWFKDGVGVEGQTNQNFVKSNVTLADAGIYSVWAANIAGETTSTNIPVYVFEGPVPPWIRFNQLPAERAVQEGSSLFMTVGGDGAQPLTYHWHKDGQVVFSSTQNSYSVNAATPEHAGNYFAVISNSVGTVTSSTMKVIVYPPQQSPMFKSYYVQTNVAEGTDLTLRPELTQGSHLVYQWHKRLNNEPIGLGAAIPGAVSLELPLGAVTYEDAANYTLVATNYAGQNQTIFVVTVVAKPIFSSPLQGYEGPAGQNVQLSASIQNWSSSLTYQWRRNGQPIPGATQSFYSFTANDASAGSYSVVVKNEAGETTSNEAAVILRPTSPSARDFHLVADYTIDVPERPGSKFRVVGDGHLRNGVVTFQSVTNTGDIGGLYRWERGERTKIVDLNDMLPSLSAQATWYDGLSAEEGGVAHFIALSTNSAGNQMSVFESKNREIKAIVSQTSEIPGKPGLRLKRFGYATRAAGQTAFFGMENETGSGGYRCVLVWDGSALRNWASSDSPLPAGDGIWWGNSSQVGFDGSTAAFWVVDKTGEGGGRNGLVFSKNAGPLQKIAFTGDTIPGGLGTFKGFNSPPRVHDGKVLFLAQAEGSSGNMLVEYAAGNLRVIAKSGDAPAGASALTTLAYNFDYLADGSILFSANGPGLKQGIYNWKNGAIAETLTTLNTIGGRLLRHVSLYDADGMDLLIAASFDGSRFGLYTTASGAAVAGPSISVARSATSLTLTWSGNGVLQESSNLSTWTDLNVPPPFQAQFSSSRGRYYRIVER